MKIEQEATDTTSKPTETKVPTAAEAFGFMLKQAREEAGFSIERIAMATRITQPFIEALEKGATDKLPGAIFVRGFIRNLCKAYGKDSKPYLHAFEEIFSDQGSKDSKFSSRDEKRHQQLQRGVLLIQPNEWKKRLKVFAPQNYLQLKPLALLGGGILIAFLAVSIIKVTQESESQLESSQKSVAEAPAQQSVQAVEPAVAKPVAPISAVTGELDVELRVKEPVSVTYTKDQDKQVTEKLQVQTYKYTFKEQMKLTVDDASRVEIYFRGQRVAEDANKNELRRFTFVNSESEIAKSTSPSNL